MVTRVPPTRNGDRVGNQVVEPEQHPSENIPEPRSAAPTYHASIQSAFDRPNRVSRRRNTTTHQARDFGRVQDALIADRGPVRPKSAGQPGELLLSSPCCNPLTRERLVRKPTERAIRRNPSFTAEPKRVSRRKIRRPCSRRNSDAAPSNAPYGTRVARVCNRANRQPGRLTETGGFVTSAPRRRLRQMKNAHPEAKENGIPSMNRMLQ